MAEQLLDVADVGRRRRDAWHMWVEHMRVTIPRRAAVACLEHGSKPEIPSRARSLVGEKQRRPRAVGPDRAGPARYRPRAAPRAAQRDEAILSSLAVADEEVRPGDRRPPGPDGSAARRGFPCRAGFQK